MELPRPGTVVRWIFALGIGLGGIYLLAREAGGADGNWLLVFAKCLYGVAALLTGILLASPEMVGWAVRPIHRVIDSLFLPAESEPPPVDFTLARFYGQRMRYAEACVEYENIVRYHPEQKLAYLEGMQAAARAGDDETARRFYRAARRRMRTRAERSLLENVYETRHVQPTGSELIDTEASGSVNLQSGI